MQLNPQGGRYVLAMKFACMRGLYEMGWEHRGEDAKWLAHAFLARLVLFVL